MNRFAPRPERASPPERTALRGASVALDHRSQAFRRDLADIGLADRVIAAHYARTADFECVAERAVLTALPDMAAEPASELLRGERFAVLEIGAEWAWGTCRQDGYVGYARAAAFAPVGADPTHRVSARLALVFADASIKSPVVARLSFGSRLAAVREAGDFVGIADGFVHRRQLASIDAREADPVTVAERFLGAPYGWGGRSEAGLDCSALVQLALQACGEDCPRDTDQQRGTIGGAVDPREPRRRGDIVYVPGHVGLMVDDTRLIHANAHWMMCVVEPLADVVARLRPGHAEPVLAVRRV